MADQEAKKSQKEIIKEAIGRMAVTEDGVLFFKYLKNLCCFERSTIIGNPETNEVSQFASIGKEYQRQIYLDVRRGFTPKAKQKIEQE